MFNNGFCLAAWKEGVILKCGLNTLEVCGTLPYNNDCYAKRRSRWPPSTRPLPPPNPQRPTNVSSLEITLVRLAPLPTVVDHQAPIILQKTTRGGSPLTRDTGIPRSACAAATKFATTTKSAVQHCPAPATSAEKWATLHASANHRPITLLLPRSPRFDSLTHRYLPSTLTRHHSSRARCSLSPTRVLFVPCGARNGSTTSTSFYHRAKSYLCPPSSTLVPT